MLKGMDVWLVSAWFLIAAALPTHLVSVPAAAELLLTLGSLLALTLCRTPSGR